MLYVLTTRENLPNSTIMDRRIADRRDAVKGLLARQEQGPAVRQQIQDLLDQPFGVRWINNLLARLRQRIGSAAFDHLIARARQDDYDVVKITERSDEEIVDIMRATGKKRAEIRYVEEHAGRLPPMGWLYWDFRKELIMGVDEAFRAIAEIHPEGETKRLTDASKACSGWEATLRIAQLHLADAKRFLGADALQITDIALDEFFKSKVNPASEWSLRQWLQTWEGKALVTGVSKIAEPVAVPAKFVSKGKLRKRRK